MKNAVSRVGRTCASLLAGGVLMAGAMLAGPVNQITVTLPHAVTAGEVTLPAGTYVVSNLEMAGGDIFVLRGEHTAPLTLRTRRVDGDPDKTEFTFTKDGDLWHFDKLMVAGDHEEFQFLNTK